MLIATQVRNHYLIKHVQKINQQQQQQQKQRKKSRNKPEIIT